MLRARLERFATDGDPEVLLHPSVLADVLALSAALYGRLLDDPGAAAVLGNVHWRRYLLLPEPDDQDDLRAALAVFTELAPFRSDLVPPEVLGFLRADQQPAGENPVREDSLGDKPQTEREAPITVDPWRSEQLEQIAAVLRVMEPAGPGPTGPVALLSDAVAGFTRYIRSGQSADVDESVALASSVVSDPEARGMLRSIAVDVLTGLLLVRYQIHGQLADLDAVIAHGRAMSRRDPSINLAGWLSNLGLALRIRFERIGEGGDLDESIALHREAAALTPATDRAAAGTSPISDLRCEFGSSATAISPISVKQSPSRARRSSRHHPTPRTCTAFSRTWAWPCGSATCIKATPRI